MKLQQLCESSNKRNRLDREFEKLHDALAGFSKKEHSLKTCYPSRSEYERLSDAVADQRSTIDACKQKIFEEILGLDQWDVHYMMYHRNNVGAYDYDSLEKIAYNLLKYVEKYGNDMTPKSNIFSCVPFSMRPVREIFSFKEGSNHIVQGQIANSISEGVAYIMHTERDIFNWLTAIIAKNYQQFDPAAISVQEFLKKRDTNIDPYIVELMNSLKQTPNGFLLGWGSSTDRMTGWHHVCVMRNNKGTN